MTQQRQGVVCLTVMLVAMCGFAGLPSHAQDTQAQEPPVIDASKVAHLKDNWVQLQRFYLPYHGKKVEVYGVYDVGYERSAIGGLWVDFKRGAWKQLSESSAYKNWQESGRLSTQIPVKFWGVLEAKPGKEYGHNGSYPGRLRVERVEVLEEVASSSASSS